MERWLEMDTSIRKDGFKVNGFQVLDSRYRVQHGIFKSEVSTLRSSFVSEMMVRHLNNAPTCWPWPTSMPSHDMRSALKTGVSSGA